MDEGAEGRARDPLKSFDAAGAYASGRAAQALFRALPLPSHQALLCDLAHRAGEIRKALDRGERVTLVAGGRTLAVYRPHPGAVLAARLRREFAAAGRVTDAMVDAALIFVPGIDRDALRLAIEDALTQEKQHEPGRDR